MNTHDNHDTLATDDSDLALVNYSPPRWREVGEWLTIALVPLIAFIAMFSSIVWGQEPVMPVGDGGVATLPIAPGLADPNDLGAIANLIWNAIMTKNWGLCASLAVLFSVAALRKWVPEHTVVGKWLRTRLGGIITNFAVTLAGAFSTMFLSGHTLSAEMVFKAVSVSLTAAGGWAIYKNIRDAMDEKKAAKAGEAAAATPADTLNK